MDGFNKVISFILGLVVIVVFVAVLSGKFNLKSKLASLGKVTPTVTSTITPTITITPGKGTVVPSGTTPGAENSQYHPYSSNPPKTIPSTGSPTMLLPLLASGLTLGSFLRRKK